MKKSLYMWFQISVDEDIQPSVIVSISSMTLHVFDLKSVIFIQFVLDYLFKQSGCDLCYLSESDVKIMINVSSYKDVKVNLFVNNKCEVDSSLREVISAYNKPLYRPSLDIDDVPDVLKLLSYFMTEFQIKMAGINFNH